MTALILLPRINWTFDASESRNAASFCPNICIMQMMMMTIYRLFLAISFCHVVPILRIPTLFSCIHSSLWGWIHLLFDSLTDCWWSSPSLLSRVLEQSENREKHSSKEFSEMSRMNISSNFMHALILLLLLLLLSFHPSSSLLLSRIVSQTKWSNSMMMIIRSDESADGHKRLAPSGEFECSLMQPYSHSRF